MKVLFDTANYQSLIEELIPFHRLIGLELVEMEAGKALVRIPFREDLVGDPRSKRIHGGVISTAMDAAGGAAVITTLSSNEDQISTVDISVDYLVAGKPKDLYVRGEIIRDGKGVVFTHMSAYHEEGEPPIAVSRAVYRVKRTAKGSE
ncbi:MAG: PaaI family thioesterase [Cyclobacteriaceae bacterium]|nr:PaaI family thioesterase [Cyclobacteriaceae bacterium]MCH8517146.1 PaaI family thioesterase [Cyclobacteriaceae bacterium]